MLFGRGFGEEKDDAGKVLREVETYTCAHCNVVVMLEDDLERHVCRLCMRRCCPSSQCRAVCSPFEKKCDLVERVEAQRRRDALPGAS